MKGGPAMPSHPQSQEWNLRRCHLSRSQLAFTVSCLGHVNISAKRIVELGRFMEARFSNTTLVAETVLGRLFHMS